MSYFQYFPTIMYDPVGNGDNAKLVTTITVEGRDTGARVTIPIEISKTQIGTTAVQGQSGVQLK